MLVMVVVVVILPIVVAMVSRAAGTPAIYDHASSDRNRNSDCDRATSP